MKHKEKQGTAKKNNERQCKDMQKKKHKGNDMKKQWEAKTSNERQGDQWKTLESLEKQLEITTINETQGKAMK